jgi:hypothetical protein
MYVSRGARRATRARAFAAVLGAALLLAACSSSGDGNKESEGDKAGAAITQQPKEADPFWVNPDGNAARQVAAYAKGGGKRVLFACGQPSCVAESDPALQLLVRAKVTTRIVHGEGEGHDYDKGPVKEQIRQALAWVVDGDATWKAAAQR